MTPLGALRAPYLPPFSWSRQRGTIVAIAVFAATMIALQLITGQGIAYFDISSISASAATLALAALGETIVILAGGLDLSAGAVISLVNVVLVTQLAPAVDMGPASSTLVALVIALGLGAAIGAVNGFLVAYVRLQSIVVTLATMFIAQGAALLVLKFPGGEMPWDVQPGLHRRPGTRGPARPRRRPGNRHSVLAAAEDTRIGTGIYAIGSDEGSAQANGVDVRRMRFLTFTFAGMCYGAAGLFITANMGGGDPLIGAKMLLQIFAAVVLGGTLIGGGRGGAVGTIFGALTLTVVVNIFLVLGVRTYYTPIVEGMILLVAVLGFSLGRDSPVVEITRFWRGDAAGAPGVLASLQAAGRGRANPPRRAGPAGRRRRHCCRGPVARPAPRGAALRRAGLPLLHRHPGYHARHLRGRLLAARLPQRHADPDRLSGDSRPRPGHGHHHRRARSLGPVDHDLPGDRRHHPLQRRRRAGGVGYPGGARDRDRHRLPSTA